MTAPTGGTRHPLVALSVADWIGIVWRVWVAQLIVGTLLATAIGALVFVAWALIVVLGIAVMAST